MKAVLLCGGTGSRLFPLTKVTNKHLVAVGTEPMLYNPLKKLVQVSSEIMVITGTEHSGSIFSLLGSGSEFGVKLTYRVQDKAGGIAEALYLAKDFAGFEPFVVVLGDNIIQDPLDSYAANFKEIVATTEKRPVGMILLKKVSDPERFGVAVVCDKRLEKLLEKPNPAPSNLAVTGVYFYCGRGIFSYIEGLSPSARGELEITDLNSMLLANETLYFDYLKGYWSDAGNHESLWKANKLVRGEL